MDFLFSWQEQCYNNKWAQRSNERDILFLPLEHIIHIFSPPCSNLYIYHWIDNLAVVSFIGRTKIRFNIWSKKDEPIRAILILLVNTVLACYELFLTCDIGWKNHHYHMI